MIQITKVGTVLIFLLILIGFVALGLGLGKVSQDVTSLKGSVSQLLVTPTPVKVVVEPTVAPTATPTATLKIVRPLTK